jgi:hypothetical protein
MRKGSKPDPDKIVKCACGLPMRQRNWRDHWYTCYTCSPVEATQRDIDNLLAYEQRRAEAAADHEEWLKAQSIGKVHP